MKIKSQFWIILLSVLIAIFFWVQSILLKEQFAVIAFPIILTNAPSVQVSNNNTPKKMSFRIRGLGYEILKLKLSKVTVQIDYRVFLNQAIDLSISDYKINIPPSVNVEVLGLVAQLGLKEGKSYGKILQLPIQIDFADDATRSLFYQRNFSPVTNVLNIRLTNSTAETVKYIETEPVQYEMLKKDKFRLKLVSPSAGIRLSNQYVEISRSSNHLVTKVISNVPIQNDINISFFPSEVTVRIRGLSEVIARVSASSIKVTLRKHNDADKEIPVDVALPSNLELIDYSPKKVFRNIESEAK